MKTKMMLVLSILTVVTFSLVRGASAQEVFDNIVDVLAKDGRFDSAYDAVIAAGLADTLASADNTYTVFVPRDRAFTNLANANPTALDFLMADPDGLLTDLLLYHVVPGEYMSADLAETETLTTAQGGELAVTMNQAGEILINGARVITADIPAKNGVIHVIDDVLIPEDIVLPEPPEPDASELLATITEVLAEDGRFTALLNALEATELSETITADGDYTLFAPTDEAFESIGELGLTEAQLRAILLFHVVGDSLTRDQLATDDLVPTMSNGRPIFVNRDGAMIQNLSGAKVETFNIPASNGIIHVIDKVMFP